jgi:hypothetical protein
LQPHTTEPNSHGFARSRATSTSISASWPCACSLLLRSSPLSRATARFSFILPCCRAIEVRAPSIGRCNPALADWTIFNGKKLHLLAVRKHSARTLSQVKGCIDAVSAIGDHSLFVTAQGGQIDVFTLRYENGETAGLTVLRRAGSCSGNDARRVTRSRDVSADAPRDAVKTDPPLDPARRCPFYRRTALSAVPAWS